MKKLFVIIIALIVSLFGIFFYGSNTTGEQEDVNYTNYEDDPVNYYGCPNSKRIKKLNLKKTAV